MRYREHALCIDTDPIVKSFDLSIPFDLLVSSSEVVKGQVVNQVHFKSFVPSEINKGLCFLDFELSNLLAVGAVSDTPVYMESCNSLDVVDAL